MIFWKTARTTARIAKRTGPDRHRHLSLQTARIYESTNFYFMTENDEVMSEDELWDLQESLLPTANGICKFIEGIDFEGKSSVLCGNQTHQL